MKIRILALLLTLCLLLPLTVLADTTPTLPDLGKFAGDHLTQGDTEDFGFCKRVTLYGTKENVKLAAEGYVALLEKYDISKDAFFSNYYDGGQSRSHYALIYTGDAEVGVVSYEDTDEGWQISDASIVITYSQYNADNYIQITYRTEFNCTDTGDRIQTSNAPKLPAAAPTPQSSTDADANIVVVQTTGTPSVNLCTVCEGTGAYNAICTACDGEGVAIQRCTSCGGDGKRVCTACDAQGYTLCGSCSGSGTRSCSSCGGTGHHSNSSHHSSNHSNKCSSCGGDGKRGCATCGGQGTRTCRSCSGAGLQQCANCQGTGTGTHRAVCTLCSGTGHHKASCSTCGGAGVIK